MRSSVPACSPAVCRLPSAVCRRRHVRLFRPERLRVSRLYVATYVRCHVCTLPRMYVATLVCSVIRAFRYRPGGFSGAKRVTKLSFGKFSPALERSLSSTLPAPPGSIRAVQNTSSRREGGRNPPTAPATGRPYPSTKSEARRGTKRHEEARSQLVVVATRRLFPNTTREFPWRLSTPPSGEPSELDRRKYSLDRRKLPTYTWRQQQQLHPTTTERAC